MKNHLIKSISFAILVVFIFLSPFKIIVIQGNSMYPTLKDKQIVLGFETNNFKRNDIVVANFEGNNIIKRVKFIEGDNFYYLLKRDLAMPMIITKEMFENYKIVSDNEIKQKLTVEKNHVFLIGDNSDVSDDSRRFGCIEVGNVKYKIIFPRF